MEFIKNNWIKILIVIVVAIAVWRIYNWWKAKKAESQRQLEIEASKTTVAETVDVGPSR